MINIKINITSGKILIIKYFVFFYFTKTKQDKLVCFESKINSFFLLRLFILIGIKRVQMNNQTIIICPKIYKTMISLINSYYIIMKGIENKGFSNS